MNSTFDKSFKKFLSKGLKVIKQIDFNEKKFENKIKKRRLTTPEFLEKKLPLKIKTN